MSFSRTAASQPSSDLQISTRVLDRIAEKEGVSPLDFDRPLAEVIDPDALNTLFQDRNVDGYIEFAYLGYTINVDSDGHVTVSDQEE